MSVADQELVALARLHADVESALSTMREFDDEPSNKAQREAWTDIAHRLTAALQPICDRALAIGATSPEGLRAKAEITEWWLTSDADELDRMMHRSLLADLAAMTAQGQREE